jgi:hypothetical protein
MQSDEVIQNNNPPMKTFSKINNTTNFQTENMIHKIHKIHKKKKNRNYKNIEPLENIHDIPETTNTSTKEGFDVIPIAKFSEDDWTQNDNIYEGGGDRKNIDTKFSAADAVNSVYNSINNLMTKIAEKIVKLLSGKTYKPSDVPIVKKYVCWFFSLIAATIAVYNWVFLMFYKVDNVRIELYDISRDMLHSAGHVNKIYALLDYLLDIPIFFPEKLQEYFVKSGPDFLSYYINISVCFIVLFSLLTRFFYTSASSFRSILIDLASFNMANPLLSFMYGTTFLLYVLSFFEFQPITTVLNVAKLVAGFPASLFMPIFSNIFKIFFLMMFSVPIAATMCFLYIFIFSFFGIPLLSNDGFFGTITKIREYINRNKYPIKDETICKPLSFLDQIINNIHIAIDFIYKYVLQLGFIIMLIYGLVDYMTNIKGPTLKMVLVLINCFLILVLGITSFITYFNEEPIQPITEVKPDVSISKEPGLSDSVSADIDTAAAWLHNNYDKLPNITSEISGVSKNLLDNAMSRLNIPNNTTKI